MGNAAPMKDPAKTLIDLSGKALEIAEREVGPRAVVTLNIRNDLAYFLAERGISGDYEKALKLIDSALADDALLTERMRATFFDTKGYCLMQIGKSKPRSPEKVAMLKEAGDFIRKAYKAETDNETRQKHLAECLDLILGLDN